MGVRLIVEALDHAPDTLTYRERYVLVVLAENARDSTRMCWPGIEDDERVIRRLRLSRTQRYRVLASLVDKGALMRVRRGQKNVRAVYSIPRFTPQCPETPDAEAVDSTSQRPENRDPDENLSVPKTGTLSESQRPGSGSSASRFRALSVPKSGTPSPQSPQSPHPRARETSKPGDASDDEEKIIDRIIQVLGEVGGVRVDRAHAARVAQQIGTGRTNPLAYVEKCIRNDPARFTPTPQPPRFTAANGFEP